VPDIFHDFPIFVSPDRVFEAVSTPDGVDRWWTKSSSGQQSLGAEWELHFGPGYDWKATVTKCDPGHGFELELTEADPDWKGARIGFRLDPGENRTRVRFHHLGWPQANEHYRISCYCWAMYLRILKRWLEHGETVPYDERLDV
jgi:uncharacterized protein YndB with AHSA1/START domain